ncbi:MAG TPA: dihydrofolate reductase family protein [Rhodothermales bacterium]|nr:dihydrofolate reductase family protein [Rhodothermales bacterium]
MIHIPQSDSTTHEKNMGKLTFNMSMSLDGFVAGPNDEVDWLFRWYQSGDTEVPFSVAGPSPKVFKVSQASAELFQDSWPRIEAIVTGRRNFDLARAWGGHPPLGVPHFVVTHHPPQEWTKEGSPFTFVTDGVESAVEQAKQAAGEQNVAVSSANVMQQCLKAGLLDEITIDLVPVLLGRGIRLFE